MAYPFRADRRVDHGAALVALAASEGCADHRWLHSAALRAGPEANRNLADLLRLFAVLHGSQPGAIETAAALNVWNGADGWFAAASAGFAAERDILARLTVAAGPAPGSGYDGATLTAVLAQRDAIETIARSDRFGCAIGAVCGLLLDWATLRATLDAAAARLDIVVRPSALPDAPACRAMLDALPDRPRLDRALSFGARQTLTHHRGLLDLLEVRAEARADEEDGYFSSSSRSIRRSGTIQSKATAM